MQENTNEYNEQQNKFRSMMPDYSEPVQYSEYDYRIGFGKRFLAYLLDLIIIWVVTTIILFVSGAIEPLLEFELSRIFLEPDEFSLIIESLTPYTVIISLLYFSSELFVCASLGKIILKIRIGDAERNFANINTLMLRFVLKHISTVLSLLSILIGLAFFGIIGSFLGIVIFVGCFFVLGRKKQALHDTLAKTAVYHVTDFKS